MESILLNMYPYPTDYILETSTNCNLNCNFCARQFTDMKYKDMEVKIAKKIIDKLPWARIFRIGVQGEPLLNPKNLEIIEYLNKKHTVASITTNATTLTPKMIKKLPLNVRVIYASVDAGSQEVYSIYRGWNFNQWRKNIVNLRKLRPDIQVQINYLLFKKNITDVPKMIDFCKKYGCSLSSTFPVIFSEGFSKEHDAYWLDGLSQLIERNRRYAILLGVNYICSTGNLEWRRCMLPWSQPLIGIQGDVYTDFFIYQPRNYNKNKPIVWEEWYKDSYKEVPQHEYIMGNIIDKSWKEIWNGRYVPFLKKLEQLNSMNIPNTKFKELYDKYPTKYSKAKELWDYCKICGRRWGYSY